MLIAPNRDPVDGYDGANSRGEPRRTGGLRGARPRLFHGWDNWVQLAEFGVVGASGYVVNVLVYALILRHTRLDYIVAATTSFVVAASWNYWWNRIWTFRSQRGRFGTQAMRFFIVSATVYGANVTALAALISLGLGKLAAQAIAIVLVTPVNFLGNKFWSFRRPRADLGATSAPQPAPASNADRAARD